MPNRGVVEKVHKVLQKLQHNISSSHLNYQSLKHYATPKAGGSLRNGNSIGGSMRNRHSFGSSIKFISSFERSARRASSELEFDDDYDAYAPYDVPQGFLVVYVGQERRRFVINAKNLNHFVFQVLLDKSAEEYGFQHKGGLVISCDVVLFEHLLWLIETEDPTLSSMEIDELVGFYAYS